MNPDWLLKHFEQISEAPDAVSRLRRFCTEYCGHAVQISQMPSGESQDFPPVLTSAAPFNIAQMPSAELVSKKSQMASGKSQGTLPEPSVRIAQTPSAQSAGTFPVKKRLMEWAEAAVQNKSGGR